MFTVSSKCLTNFLGLKKKLKDNRINLKIITILRSSISKKHKRNKKYLSGIKVFNVWTYWCRVSILDYNKFPDKEIRLAFVRSTKCWMKMRIKKQDIIKGELVVQGKNVMMGYHKDKN